MKVHVYKIYEDIKLWYVHNLYVHLQTPKDKYFGSKEIFFLIAMINIL